MAVAWYRKAALQGNAEAQANLGFMLAEGRGGLRDDAQALSWYRKAIAQGNASAQFYLGLMYAHGGSALPKDYAKAVSWYRKAAAQDAPNAQNELGFMYSDGRGVPQDAAEAVRLEEHTSELQSLMRISYAVFCLKKTTTLQTIQK